MYVGKVTVDIDGLQDLQDELGAAVKLYIEVRKFMQENNITREETIYQNDRVIANAYDFIGRLCEIVGYDVAETEDE